MNRAIRIELVIDVAINGLKPQQKQYFQADHGQARESNTESRAPANAARRPPPTGNHAGNGKEQSSGPRHQPSEFHVRNGVEDILILAVELRAPKRNIEVVSDRRQIAVDGCIRARLNVLLQIGDTVGHHAKRNVVLPDIARFQVP